MKIVIVGGHHSSALPVISYLKQFHKETQLFWIGHKFSAKNDKNPTLEFNEIISLGIPFYDLKAGKVYKTYDLMRLLRVPFGFLQAFWFLIQIRPQVILSFGGYLAVPVVVAGWFLGIPSVTHEQTVVVGYANKVIALFARKVLISWKASAKYFPKNKVVYTGLPLRTEITNVSSASFNSENTLPIIYITAGKTGSHKLNEIVLQSLPKLLSFANVIHQCGDNSVFNDFMALDSAYKSVQNTVKGSYYLRKFVLSNEIGEAFAKSNLVISRAGAHTTSEILYLCKPTLFIPIPWVSHNEQLENALVAKNAGVAEILGEKDLTSDTLVSFIQKMLTNLAKYTCPDAKDMFVANSSEIIVKECFNAAQKAK